MHTCNRTVQCRWWSISPNHELIKMVPAHLQKSAVAQPHLQREVEQSSTVSWARRAPGCRSLCQGSCFILRRTSCREGLDSVLHAAAGKWH